MRVLGIDIGSRFIKLAILENGKPPVFKKTETSFNPIDKCCELLGDTTEDRIIATGYGRHLLEVHMDARTLTEIKAHAVGARALFRKCRTIIDIGGQDTKVISLDAEGQVKKFEMNDRCAAGTGKFIEVMAKSLGYSMEEFGALPAKCGREIQINSMCTVFAESEVVSLIAKGEAREDIAVALHRSIASRVLSMLRRIPVEGSVVFAGGCARNRCLRDILEQLLGMPLLTAETPDITGALGAALCALEE
jgi:(R)-2-hydroxyacyl-CoA dehydratese activating ATPase